MPEVAKMLGVEIGEEFNVLNEDGGVTTDSPYKIEDNAFLNCYGILQSHILVKTLRGNYSIQKLPWKPKFDEICWFIRTDGTMFSDYFRADSQHLSMLNMGNCFNDPSEAELHVKEIIEKYNEIKREMVK